MGIAIVGFFNDPLPPLTSVAFPKRLALYLNDVELSYTSSKRSTIF